MAANSTSAQRKEVAEPSDQEVYIVRLIDAPRDLVFRAWTDPEQLLNWYAPRGCAISFRKIDPRQGGTFQSCIHTPDGHNCWCCGVYREVLPPERLVYTMNICDENGTLLGPSDVGMDPDWPRETVLTLTLSEQGNKTLLTLHQTVSETLAKRTGAHPSWLQMLDRLSELLSAER